MLLCVEYELPIDFIRWIDKHALDMDFLEWIAYELHDIVVDHPFNLGVDSSSMNMSNFEDFMHIGLLDVVPTSLWCIWVCLAWSWCFLLVYVYCMNDGLIELVSPLL